MSYICIELEAFLRRLIRRIYYFELQNTMNRIWKHTENAIELDDFKNDYIIIDIDRSLRQRKVTSMQAARAVC